MTHPQFIAGLREGARIASDLRHPSGWSSENEFWLSGADDASAAITSAADRLAETVSEDPGLARRVEELEHAVAELNPGGSIAAILALRGDGREG